MTYRVYTSGRIELLGSVDFDLEGETWESLIESLKRFSKITASEVTLAIDDSSIRVKSLSGRSLLELVGR